MDISLAAIEACTDGFSESKKVGSGAYGKVYKVYPLCFGLFSQVILVASTSNSGK